MNRWQERALAFAGMAQSVNLVATIAKRGIVSQDALDGCLATIFVTNPASTKDIFKHRPGIISGLGLTVSSLRHFNNEHAELIRYVFALIQLQTRLRSDPESLRELGARIAAVDEKRLLDQISSDDTAGLLSDIYDEILGRFPPRIMVTGEQQHLQSPINVMRIRALLLAGIRSGVLWSQLGGRTWQLVFRRGVLRLAAEEARQDLKSGSTLH